MPKLYKHVYELTIYATVESSMEKQLSDYFDMMVDGIEDEPGVVNAFFAINEPVPVSDEEIREAGLDDYDLDDYETEEEEKDETQ